MNVKATFAILTALFGFYSDRAVSGVQYSVDYPNCETNKAQQSFNLNCYDSDYNRITMNIFDHTLYITHDGQSSIILELETFPKDCLESINQIRSIQMKNCAVPDGHSFGKLFEHLGIKNGILGFTGINIGSTLDGHFSSGFEEIENLTLSRNKIRELNNGVFGSLTKLTNLDLSQNSISTIDENVFTDLKELKKLKLFRNKLKSLPDGMFQHQKRLEVLLLDGNELQTLTMQMFEGLDSLTDLSIEKNSFSNIKDDVFHNLPRLTQISFGNDNISVPNAIFAKQIQLEYVFLENVKLEEGLQLSGPKFLQIKWSNVMNISGLSNITKVSIIGSLLEPLAVISFKGLNGTKVLDLSSNSITHLVDGMFDGLKELDQLVLSKNHLTNISALVFGDLQNLIAIDLSNNILTTIHSNAFINTKKLETINLTNNQLSFNDIKFPFMHLFNLKTLKVSNNKLTRVPTGLTKLEKLKEVDMRFNQISSVKFGELRQALVNLTGNPLVCDCGMFDFLTGVDQEKVAEVFRLNCRNNPVYMRKCPRETESVECPADCSCTERTDGIDVHMLISCTNKGLTSAAEIEIPNATSIELDLSNNNLTKLPMLRSNGNVTFVRASFNQISEISLENIPPNLRGLDLSHNNIETIAASVIDHLKNHPTLEVFFVKKNPLACHCFSNDTDQFIKFVTDNSSITDLQGAKCNVNDELTVEELEKNCRNSLLVHGLIFVTILSLITGILSVLVIRHIEFIKMWLYAHDWFMWWVDEEYVDRHKVYDVFISYANENRDLALYLVKVLEDCYLSYKFCEHERDFIGGKGIEESVVEAVRDSRRTMVILSENYLKSEWCTHEFHLALERSLTEKRQIIIAIKYGHLGKVADADSIIESYIKTHTYIESNDKWFWERLLYALPHRKQKKKNALIIRR